MSDLQPFKRRTEKRLKDLEKTQEVMFEAMLEAREICYARNLDDMVEVFDHIIFRLQVDDKEKEGENHG